MQKNIDDIAAEAIADGLLDDDAITEGMLALHQYFRDAGLDPEDPDIYHATVACISIIASFTARDGDFLHAMEAVGRFALRAYADIKARG